MAILAVGGEAECFEVEAPNNLRDIGWGYQGFSDKNTEPCDRHFSRGTLTFQYPSYLNFVEANGVQTVWLHFMWNPFAGGSRSRGGVPTGFTFMRDGSKLARMAYDAAARKYFIQTSHDGTSWTNRGNGWEMSYTDKIQRHMDFRVTFGAAIEVFRDGVKIDSYYGPFTTLFTRTNRVLFDFEDGFMSEVIAADSSTIGMRLYTYSPAVGGLSTEWDNSNLYNSESAFVLLQEIGVYWGDFISTGHKDVLHMFSTTYQPQRFNKSISDYTYVYWDFFDPANNFEYIAIAVAAAFRNIPTSEVTDAVFVLSDGNTQYYESPSLGVGGADSGKRAQWILNAKPLSGDAFGATDIRTLQPGVLTK